MVLELLHIFHDSTLECALDFILLMSFIITGKRLCQGIKDEEGCECGYQARDHPSPEWSGPGVSVRCFRRARRIAQAFELFRGNESYNGDPVPLMNELVVQGGVAGVLVGGRGDHFADDVDYPRLGNREIKLYVYKVTRIELAGNS